MKRELSDEAQQVKRAFHEMGSSSFRLGLGELDEDRAVGEALQAWSDLQKAVGTLAYRQFIEGVALGFLISERHDLIVHDAEIEKAAVVLVASFIANRQEPPELSEE